MAARWTRSSRNLLESAFPNGVCLFMARLKLDVHAPPHKHVDHAERDMDNTAMLNFESRASSSLRRPHPMPIWKSWTRWLAEHGMPPITRVWYTTRDGQGSP